MLKQKRLKKRSVGISQISAFAIFLLLGYSQVAVSAEASAQVERTSLKLAPIRLAVSSGGRLTYALRRQAFLDRKTSDQSLGLLVFYGVQAQSFIWQPWFARVNGGLNLNVNNNVSNATGYSTNKSTGLDLLSNISLRLVPGSRFPFSASISKSNGRQRSGLTANDSTSHSTTLTLTQGYSSLNKFTRASANLNHTTGGNSTAKISKKDLFFLNIDHRPSTLQTLFVEGETVRDLRPLDNFRSLTSRLNSSHSYKPNNTLSVNSIFSIINTSYKQDSSTSNASSQQFNSLGNWRLNNSALTITGGVRLINSSENINNGTNKKNSANNLFLASNYIFSKGIRASGSINIHDELGVQTASTNFSLTSTKAFSDITNISGFVYKRFLSGSLSNNNSTSSGSSQKSNNSQSLGISAGHSLTNNTRLFDNNLISNINQVISSSISSTAVQASTPQLATTGSMSWARAAKLDRSTSRLRVTASDSRPLGNNNGNTVGAKQGSIDTFNLQGSRNEGLTRNQSLLGNVTLQKVYQSASNTTNTNASAAINYSHTRLFNISSLIFVSTLQVNNNLSNSQNEQSFLWENNFAYHIGKLDFKLDTRISRIGKSNQTSLLFFTTRSF
jgi:hypothetical protein